MKTFSTFLHEAAFGKKDLVRAKKLIVRILQRRTGMIFYPYGKEGIVRFRVKGDNGPGSGGDKNSINDFILCIPCK